MSAMDAPDIASLLLRDPEHPAVRAQLLRCYQHYRGLCTLIEDVLQLPRAQPSKRERERAAYQERQAS